MLDIINIRKNILAVKKISSTLIKMFLFSLKLCNDFFNEFNNFKGNFWDNP